MKLMTLNTWGARAGIHGLTSFFERHRDVDVFCLQEIWEVNERDAFEMIDPRIVGNLLSRIAEALPDHRYFFRPQYRGIYGLATFVRKSISVVNEGEFFVFKHQGYENPVSIGNHARNIQYLDLQTEQGPLTVVNFHGLWNGQGKSDTEDRLQQSRTIAQFLTALKNPFALLGDFNLNPDTSSFKLLEDAADKNLVKLFNVTSTRTSFYQKPGKFADYILTRGLKAVEFAVLPDEVSDHAPLVVRVQFAD